MLLGAEHDARSVVYASVAAPSAPVVANPSVAAAPVVSAPAPVV